MKRRDFIKKGSAVVATTVVGSTIASCGGGDTTASEKRRGGGGMGSGSGNTNPGTTPDTGAGTTPVETTPVSNPPASTTTVDVAPIPDTPTPGMGLQKTFFITEGTMELMDATLGTTPVHFKSFSLDSTKLTTPGQGLIVYEGDSVEITIVNPSNSRPHRFIIREADSVNNNKKSPGVIIADSGVINSGQTVTVTFIAGKPGTYLYEDPTLTQGKKAYSMVGMHGGFAIMPKPKANINAMELFAGSRTYLQQLFWVFNDISPAFSNAVGNNINLPKFVPSFFTMNGLSGRPPAPLNGSPSTDNGYGNPKLDSMHDPRSMLVGYLGKRALMRCINMGMAKHSMHIHANHLEWLTDNRRRVDGALAGTTPTEKDVIPLTGSGGICDVIYPFDAPPDAWPVFNEATIRKAEDENPPRKIAYPMHFHDEMTQTANGGSYLFGTMTDVFYKRDPNKV